MAMNAMSASTSCSATASCQCWAWMGNRRKTGRARCGGAATGAVLARAHTRRTPRTPGSPPPKRGR
eukprot:3373841-Prorocentrum_lima.AAC.1